tara:strand:+ start:1299 stop:1421 length:123 start_codon:yes stop_codon:yes gene_type:complete
MKTLNMKAMMTKIIHVVVRVALVGRMVPNSCYKIMQAWKA